MIIPEKSWINYINLLSAISKTAAKRFSAYVNDPRHDLASPEGRKAAIDYAAALADAYGESAAAVACQMYDAVAEASKVAVPSAVPAMTPTYGEVAKTVNGMLKHNHGSDALGSSIGRLVKRTGVDTTRQNALRDGVEFAWVPYGDTCGFCIMLASNGWQRASKKTVKGDHAEHIHANCDCTFAVRFNGNGGVEGYDPEKYKEIFDNAEGDSWQEKVNSLNSNAQNNKRAKEKINARESPKLQIDTNNKPIVTNTPPKVLNPTYGCKDVTNDWMENATPNTHRVGKVTTFIQDGKTYTVDGVNVQFNPGEEEKKVASILSRTLGGEILLMPTVRGIYSNVRTPDFLFHGERLELKTPRNYSKSVLFRSIRGNHEQAENFVIDITACKMTEAEIRRQVEKVYLDPFTSFVKNLIIIKDDGVYAIFERKK